MRAVCRVRRVRFCTCSCARSCSCSCCVFLAFLCGAVSVLIELRGGVFVVRFDRGFMCVPALCGSFFVCSFPVRGVGCQLPGLSVEFVIVSLARNRYNVCGRNTLYYLKRACFVSWCVPSLLGAFSPNVGRRDVVLVPATSCGGRVVLVSVHYWHAPPPFVVN